MSKKQNKKKQMRQALQNPYRLEYPYAPHPTPPKKKGGGVIWTLLIIFALLFAALIFLLWQNGTISRFIGGGQGTRTVEFGPGLALGETQDAGNAYIEETLFLGDSNTVRLSLMGAVPEEQVLAQSGIGIGAVDTLELVQIEGHSGRYTILQAVEIIRPDRVLMAFGSNDVGNTTPEAFTQQYADAIAALRRASPDTHIVISAIPPVLEYSSYPKLTREEILKFNDALLNMCIEIGVAFLDSHEELSAPDGFAHPEYMEADGIHLTQQGVLAWMDYYREHAYNV